MKNITKYLVAGMIGAGSLIAIGNIETYYIYKFEIQKKEKINGECKTEELVKQLIKNHYSFPLPMRLFFYGADEACIKYLLKKELTLNK